jgi:hypothetical protein
MKKLRHKKSTKKDSKINGMKQKRLMRVRSKKI